MANCCLI